MDAVHSTINTQNDLFASKFKNMRESIGDKDKLNNLSGLLEGVKMEWCSKREDKVITSHAAIPQYIFQG